MTVTNVLTLLIVAACSLFAPSFVRAGFRRPQRWLSALAAQSRLCVIAVGLVSFSIHATYAWLTIIPEAAVQDEFAYLLTADTFARGRLSNPTHEFADHFESYHIFQKPTYQGKYPPAQSTFLAVGQILTGAPIVGVWLSMALAAAAQCWMLQAWVPRRWVLPGTFLFVFSDLLLVNWGQTYWGGGTAWLGGSLLFGALPRLVSPQSSRFDAIWLACGLSILANSRPFEGLLAAIPAIAWLSWYWFRTQAFCRSRFWTCQFLPIASVLVTAAALMGVYNHAVTGSATTLPYQVWAKQYGVSMAGMLTGGKVKDTQPKPYVLSMNPDNPWTEKICREVAAQVARHSRTWKALSRKLTLQFEYYAFPATWMALLGLPLLTRRRSVRIACAALALTCSGIVINRTSGHPHYSAPVGCLGILAIIEGLRGLQLVRWPSRRTTRVFPCMILLAAPIAFAGHLYERWWEIPCEPYRLWALSRSHIQNQLIESGGQHVLFVRYLPEHNIHWEWIYNSAEIDEQQVVWARDLGQERNSPLVDYYDDRTAWVAVVQNAQARIIPYEEFPAVRRAMMSREAAAAGQE